MPEPVRGIRNDQYVGGAQLRSLVMDHMDRCRTAERTRRDLDTLVNLRWFHGRPWFRRSEANTIQEIKPQHRWKYINNLKFFEVIRTLSGVMTYTPKMDAWPTSQDRGDRARTRMTRTVGNHIIQNGGLDRAFHYAQDLVQVGAYCGIKPVWDPTAGPSQVQMEQVPCEACGGQGVVPSGLTGALAACSVCSAQGIVPGPFSPDGYKGAGYVQNPTGRRALGDVRWQVVPPWELFPEPEALTMNSANVIVHRRRMSRLDAWKQYGSAAGFHEEDFRGSVDSDLDIGTSIMRGGPMGYERANDDRSVLVYEYWANPSEQFEDGLYGVMVGDQEVIFDKLPYVINRHALFILTGYELYGALYPICTGDLVLPLCLALNDHLSASHAYAKLTSKLRFKVARESGFEIDDETGNVFYKHIPNRPPPEEIRLSAQPQDAANMIQFLADAVERVSGAVDVMRGGTEDGQTSARAGAWFKEQSLQPLMPVITQQAGTLDQAIKYGIDLFKLHAEPGRKLRLTGQGGSYEVQEFDDGVMGDSDDVHINMTRDLRGRSAKVDEIQKMVELQIISPAEARTMGEFADTLSIHQNRALHENQANVEFETLERNGWIPPPQEFQKHDIHLEVHGQQLIEMEIDTPPNDPKCVMLRDHMRQTRMIKNQEAVADAMEQAQAQQQMAPAAATYGMANAATGSFQPQTTQAASPSDNNTAAGAGAPGSQPSLQAASADARTADTAAKQTAGGTP